MKSKMKEFNVRYGVVDVVKRKKHEKTTWSSYGHDFISRNKLKAIQKCRDQKSGNVIVERIFDTPKARNNKVEIFRGGNYTEKE